MIKQTETKYRKDFNYYSNDQYIGRSLELYGEYQQAEINFLLELINNRCTVYDIGANIGYHTNAFASVAQRVISFEPNPKNFNLFAKNTQGLENVFGLMAAIGAKTETLKCSDFDPDKEGNFGNIKVGQDGDIDVPVIALDEYKELPLPDLIKIDVEGMEYEVMLGMKNIITTRTPAIYFEAHETEELPEIYDMLKPLNYNLYWAVIPNYFKNNWKNNTNNIFGNSVLISILAWPKHLGSIALSEVLDREDNWKKLLERNAIKTE